MADGRFEHSPALPVDPVIEAYKKDIDRTLLRERLRRTPAQRVIDFVAFAKAADAIRGVARSRAGKP